MVILKESTASSPNFLGYVVLLFNLLNCKRLHFRRTRYPKSLLRNRKTKKGETIMKKLLALSLALIMALGLIACGNSSTPAATSAGNAAAPAGDTKTDAPKGEILIGCLQDITGNTSALGKSVQAGAQAAVDEINANGGIGGQTLVMKTYDTKGDVTEAVNAYITAVTVDKVALIVGPPVANIANAIKETSEDYDVPVVGLAMDPSCQLKADGTPYAHMFCLQPSALTQGQIMASFALKNGLKTFGVLYNQENAYSVSLLDPFLDTLSEGGVTVDPSLIVAYGASDTDYKTLLQPIVAAGVDAIYCPNYTQQLVAICTAAAELGYTGKVINGLDAAPSFNTTYGGDCSNVYFINNINTEDETTAAMIEQIADKVSAPNKYFLGYDIVMACKQSIEKVGLDASALCEEMASLDYTGLTGHITIDPTTHMPKGMGMFMYTYDYQTPVMLEEFAG